MAFTALISAEPGWRALFGTADGVETGRSRIIAWVSIESSEEARIVGVIADPNDPKRLVTADTITDDEGGTLVRYGFVE